MRELPLSQVPPPPEGKLCVALLNLGEEKQDLGWVGIF